MRQLRAPYSSISVDEEATDMPREPTSLAVTEPSTHKGLSEGTKLLPAELESRITLNRAAERQEMPHVLFLCLLFWSLH
jgi:hypothetical protein